MRVDNILNSLNNSGKQNLANVYSDILVRLDTLHGLEHLLNDLNEYDNNGIEVTSEEGVNVDDVLRFINNWVVDNYIVPSDNVIISKEEVTPIFISTYLEFIVGLFYYNVVTTHDVHATLSCLEDASVTRLAYVLGLYSAEVTPHDVYTIVTSVPDTTTNTWLTMVEMLIANPDTDDNVIEYATKLTTSGNALIRTYVANHIIRNSEEVLSKTALLEYITKLVSERVLSSATLGVELLAFGIYFGVGKFEMRDIIDTLFSSLDTDMIYSYVRVKLPEVLNESYE